MTMKATWMFILYTEIVIANIMSTYKENMMLEMITMLGITTYDSCMSFIGHAEVKVAIIKN